ncbi:MAG TPA: two-component regulator propeller domain-containing protein [Puia sp.]|nr:two-component regulator propeller domain-containing protein [Puia sp.]
MKYTHTYTLFLMFVFNTSCGQKQTEPHKDNINYDVKDMVTSYGPNTMVRNVKQGRNGNILIAASWGGVFRYDGKSFTNITSKIGSRRFWNVLEDRRGNFWFASTDSGVYYYDGKSFQHFTTKDGLPDNGVRTIMEDKIGKFWFATEGGPCFYDGKTFTVLKNKDGKGFKNVWSIIEDKKGSIWFGDVDGLWRYDGRTFTKVSQLGAYAIIEDKKGSIWTTGWVDPGEVGAWALSRYDAKSLYDKMPTVTEIKSGGRMDFLGILEANDGSIWFGSGGGVHRYDGKTFTDFKSKKDQQ